MKLLKQLLTLLIISQFYIGTAYGCETSQIILAEAVSISLDDAVADVKKKKLGKVLSAETVEIDGKAVHVIKVLKNDGRVKKLNVPSSPTK